MTQLSDPTRAVRAKTLSAGSEWKPSAVRRLPAVGTGTPRPPQAPDNETLLSLARRNPPPASWWDEDENPFEPPIGK